MMRLIGQAKRQMSTTYGDKPFEQWAYKGFSARVGHSEHLCKLGPYRVRETTGEVYQEVDDVQEKESDKSPLYSDSN